MSAQDTLNARQKRYGEFTDNARIAQNLKDIMRLSDSENDGEGGWSKLTPDQKEALDMIQTKISRLLTGDPNYPDNWHDIQGFAKLVENRLLTGSSYKEPAKKK